MRLVLVHQLPREGELSEAKTGARAIYLNPESVAFVTDFDDNGVKMPESSFLLYFKNGEENAIRVAGSASSFRRALETK